MNRMEHMILTPTGTRGIFATLFLLLLLTSTACAGTSETEKKYPPYPEVWGYELPYPMKGDRYSHIRPFKFDNGNLVFTYIERKVIRKSKDGASGKELYPALISFFDKKSKPLSKGEYKKFWKDHRKMRFYPDSWQKILFEDGTYIKQNSTGGGNCYAPYHYFLEKRDNQNKIIARKTLFYLLKEPKKIGLQPSCGAEGEVVERVSAGPLKVIALADDTFLVYEYKGNYILRLDKDFHTEYPINQTLFLVNTDIVDAIRNKARVRYPDNADNDKYFQYINDAVYRHILSLQ